MPDSEKYEAHKSDDYMSELERSASVRPVDNVDDIAKAAAQGSGDRAVVLMDLDNGLVGWESADDPDNPQNWTLFQKWFLMTWVIIMCTFSPMISSICAPGTSLTLDEFDVSSRTIGTLMITIYVLGYAVGPLFLAPLSEMYGRAIVINWSTAFFNAFLLGCSLAPNMPALIAMRLLAGIGGSAIMTIVSSCIGDVFRVHERAAASAIVIGTPSISPILGPILGGFISQSLGWRWAYWIVMMVTVPVNVLMFWYLRESNHPTILERKTRRLRKQLGRDDLYSQLEMKLPPREVLVRSLVRPMKFLFKSPIILIVALYVSTVYGILYLMLATIPSVFQDIYHFEVQYTGLAYIGFGLGQFTAIGFMIKYNDKKVIKLRDENGGKFEPEMRLANTIYAAPFVPLSLFWYGWTTRPSIHWIVPCLAFFPFGFGLGGIFIPCQTYAVDAFLETSASAVAVMVFTRSVFGAFLPLVGPVVYETLGLGMGNTVLGILALLVTPAPFAFIKWGGQIRRRWPVEF